VQHVKQDDVAGNAYLAETRRMTIGVAGGGRDNFDSCTNADAMSEAVRTAVNQWIDRTIYTRLDDKMVDVIIAVMQRLHLEDPAGHILSKEEVWDHLNLPAIAEVDEVIPIGPGKVYVRKAGELLHAAREPQEVLDRLRRELGSFSFSAQYQQRPVPLEGELIKAAWFRIYDELPAHGEDDCIVQSWDTASTAEEFSDYSACTTWLIQDKSYYLIDVRRERLNYPDLKRAVVEQAHAFGCDTVLIENRGSGTSLIQDLEAEGGRDMPDIIPCDPEGDKVTRMHRYSARIEAGRVYLPRNASWLGEFQAEMLQFPRGRHDDQVDSVSQLLNWAEEHWLYEPQVFFV
jgi:predicted phage terminase large subunit-like protein